MEPVFAGLLTAGIGLARDVLATFRSTKGDAATTTIERTVVVRERTEHVERVVERGIDKATLQKVIAETNRHFVKLLDTHTAEIITEIRLQRIKDAVQEVQARVVSLKTLLNSPPVDQNVAMQLVISALNPLQVSLEVARFRLQDNGEHDAWRYCYLVGTSALIAGYAFLDHDASHLVVELQSAMYDSQRSILNATATTLLAAKREIPWENVPRFLSPEGADELLQLYEATLGPNKAIKPGKTFNVNEMTVADVRSTMAKVKDRASLQQLLRDERRSRQRQGVIEAVQARLREIKSP